MTAKRRTLFVAAGLVGLAGVAALALDTEALFRATDDSRRSQSSVQNHAERVSIDPGPVETASTESRRPVPATDASPADDDALPADQLVPIDSLPPDDAKWVRYLLRRALNSWDRHGMNYPKTTPLITPANARALLALQEAWQEKINAADNAYLDHMRHLVDSVPEENRGVLPDDSGIDLEELWAKRFGAEAVKTGHSIVSNTKSGERFWVFVPRGQDPELDALEGWVADTNDLKHEFLYSRVPQFFFWP